MFFVTVYFATMASTKMRFFANTSTLLLLVFFPLVLLAGTEKPQRIVSLSLCTDQVLLQLVEPERIAAIAYLSQDPIYSYYWQLAKNINTHAGLAENIIPLKPDLIIGSAYTTGNVVHMLSQLGYQTTTFPSPTTLQQAEQYTRDIGIAVGEPERAEQLIKTMRQDIATAKAITADKPEQLAISYGPNGFTAGKNTLKNEIINAAGYRNLATELGIDYYGNVSLEQLILSNPDIIIVDEDIPDQNSLAQRITTHPILKQLMHNRDTPSMPTNHWICPGPLASKAILTLAEQRH
jgi:iron complex transport system substrate-binding protein